jgi:hypothetical protein
VRSKNRRECEHWAICRPTRGENLPLLLWRRGLGRGGRVCPFQVFANLIDISELHCDKRGEDKLSRISASVAPLRFYWPHELGCGSAALSYYPAKCSQFAQIICALSNGFPLSTFNFQPSTSPVATSCHMTNPHPGVMIYLWILLLPRVIPCRHFLAFPVPNLRSMTRALPISSRSVIAKH